MCEIGSSSFFFVAVIVKISKKYQFIQFIKKKSLVYLGCMRAHYFAMSKRSNNDLGIPPDNYNNLVG